MHLYAIFGGLCLAVFVHVSVVLFKWITSPVRGVPGPFWARFSKLWFFRRVYLGHFEEDNIKLHQKYGPVVRVAPNMFSIDLPDSVNQVYGISSKLPKAEWYDGWKHPSPDRWTLFPDRNISRHSETRRRFQALYSMSSLVSYEAYVDECTDLLQKRLTEFSRRDETINMIHWLQCYAFDVIGDITYSKRLGFLDRGEDVSGLMVALHGAMVYSTLIGIYASLHPYVYAVLDWLNIGGAAGRTFLMKFVESRIQQRKDEKSGGIEKAAPSEDGPQDFLEKLLIQNEENPQKVTSYHVFMMGLSNIIAGSDTTAISLSAVMRNLIQNGKTMETLREEIEGCISSGQWDGHSHMTFKCTKDMPYLQAVIKESLRMHAATGLPLWRVVPSEGMQLGDWFFPGGSVIGLNTWCAHYNQDVFGKDAGQFRPERWIEAEKAGGTTLSRMNSYYLPFGLGSRTCIGRHISYLEMSKLIPLLVRNFDFEIEDSARAWKTVNYWFVKPTDFWLKVKTRAGMGKDGGI